MKNSRLDRFTSGFGQRLYRRAKSLIPRGTQLVSKRPEMFAPDIWPAYYKRANGLPAGHCLEEQDVSALRPGGGLNIREMKMVLEKRLKRTLPAQHMLSMDDLH